MTPIKVAITHAGRTIAMTLLEEGMAVEIDGEKSLILAPHLGEVGAIFLSFIAEVQRIVGFAVPLEDSTGKKG